LLNDFRSNALNFPYFKKIISLSIQEIKIIFLRCLILTKQFWVAAMYIQVCSNAKIMIFALISSPGKFEGWLARFRRFVL